MLHLGVAIFFAKHECLMFCGNILSVMLYSKHTSLFEMDSGLHLFITFHTHFVQEMTHIYHLTRILQSTYACR